MGRPKDGVLSYDFMSSKLPESYERDEPFSGLVAMRMDHCFFRWEEIGYI